MAETILLDKIMTRSETAKQLRISVQMLDDLRALKKIAFIKIGRKVVFKQSEVVRFIEKNTVS